MASRGIGSTGKGTAGTDTDMGAGNGTGSTKQVQELDVNMGAGKGTGSTRQVQEEQPQLDGDAGKGTGTMQVQEQEQQPHDGDTGEGKGKGANQAQETSSMDLSECLSSPASTRHYCASTDFSCAGTPHGPVPGNGERRLCRGRPTTTESGMFVD